jgi:hypothetical protein
MTSDTAHALLKSVNHKIDVYTDIAASRSPFAGIGRDGAGLTVWIHKAFASASSQSEATKKDFIP